MIADLADSLDHIVGQISSSRRSVPFPPFYLPSAIQDQNSFFLQPLTSPEHPFPYTIFFVMSQTHSYLFTFVHFLYDDRDYDQKEIVVLKEILEKFFLASLESK